jgi:hypothetical protein
LEGQIIFEGKVHKIISPACVYIPIGAVHEYKVTQGAGHGNCAGSKSRLHPMKTNHSISPKANVILPSMPVTSFIPTCADNLK